MAILRFMPFILMVVLLVAALVDMIRTEPSRVRAMPKWAWAFIIVVVVIIGPVLWFSVGREPLPKQKRRGPVAPDDDPEFLRRINLEKEQQDRIRDLEEQLRDLDGDRGSETPRAADDEQDDPQKPQK